MPFSHFHYRCMKASNYTAKLRRRCYIYGCLIYGLMFAIAGFVFLGLWIKVLNTIAALNCSDCAYLGAITPCGSQLCCDAAMQLKYSYDQCVNVFGQGLYFILAYVFLIYAVYEILAFLLMLCNGSAFDQFAVDDVIVVEPNQQLIDMSAYPQEYQTNYTPQTNPAYNQDY